MSEAIETKIDDRSRPGAMSGLVSPGERYLVDRISPVELRMRLLAPADVPLVKPVRRSGKLMIPQEATRALSKSAIRDAIRDDRENNQRA
jgi:hypothetical protein